eukprot:CAMPEP_0184977194 /NCGR_PEP_ID=MMETSP1098-20130426/7922_1 /TAXON_ID=89044 /ORGANISM="Spumella elongata, Strain CCAP 955/1" /LENGTH=1647 /DNA_ID=CAMNT_0027500153 /DNA_START=145 /DNA_END=5088 /DNA_ORIENTATION=-
MSVRYKQAYAKLGEERVQFVDKEKLTDNRTKKEIERDNRRGLLNNAVEQFWASRVDQNWSKSPGYFWKPKRSKEKKFMSLVPRILVQLEPNTTFNPLEAWQSELDRQEKDLKEQLNPGSTSAVAQNAANQKMKKADILIAKNAALRANERYVAEITRIRNSKKNLIDILRDIKLPDARAVLIIQILRKGYDDFKKNGDKKLLYETMWAIEGASHALPTVNAPQPLDEKSVLVRDATLVYDDYAEVERLLKKCRKIMQQESDLVRLQLVEMSDSLPPLTKFNFGLRLDPWQKRVLAWIDAGKSVVICAPTSSGKTVLSSYVAIIFRAQQRLEEGEEGDKKKGGDKTAALPAWEEEGAGEEMDEDGSEDEGEGCQGAGSDDEDWEEEEEEEEEESAVAQPSAAKAATEDDSSNQDGESLARKLVKQDRMNRKAFLEEKIRLAASGNAAENSSIRVLFVVPTEPLVWQVAAYFTKLLRQEGDQDSKVGIVTDHLTYYPPKKFDVMPQIVVGTPFALETALTKPRGLVGKFETNKRAQGDLLPGGFDHFDWAIYDEVHSLDGAEGAALQRLIRSMNCKFLALSATVGNAEELRGWMERARGDYELGLEAIDVTPDEVGVLAKDLKSKAVIKVDTQASGKIRIVKTVTNEFKVIANLKATDTLQTLKERVAAEWPALDTAMPDKPHTAHLFQMLFQGQDLVEDTIQGLARGASRTLGSFGLFQNGPDAEEVVYVRSFVNMLTHHGRFINLQRYVWNQNATLGSGVLQTASPLLAVQSVQSLQEGVLDNSSLSFTSRDSYKLWEEIRRIYPADAAIVHQLNPNNFFGKEERITLQRTKDYEDLLKSGLKTLADQFPVETKELLHAFQIPDPAKEFDLCELVLDLKGRDMLPCLPFHLNTFEAIRLFQNILAGIEWRQKKDHPTYYLEMQQEKDLRKKDVAAQIKNTGKNDKALDEAAKAGDIDLDQNFEVDEFLPHPNYTFTKGMPLSDLELTNFIDEMEKNDGFEKRDNTAMSKLKGQNLSILKHALIRGLRRGIGLFIDEVSFPSYRRAVQRLASAGKLGVVISDDSLAFGVNMPFRTCVFCGEMFGMLDELMAQQMSGRAGRRGLDTQGNLVYAGMRVSRIRRLMIGTVSHITGRDHNPRYESLALQPVLSPRHVGWNRAEVVAGRTLDEHVSKREMAVKHYTMDESTQCMMDLGILTQNAAGMYVPNQGNGYNMALLSIVWHLRDRMHESATIGVLFPEIMSQFIEIVRDISLNEKKLTNEKTEAAVYKFFVVLALLVNRTSYEQAAASGLKQAGTTPVVAAEDGTTDLSSGAVRLQDVQYFALPAHNQFLAEWTGLFKESQTRMIPDRWAALRDPVSPDVDIDGTFFQCILDRRCVHLLSDLRKQEIKAQLWHAGNVLRTFKNCSWPEESFNRVAFIIFRTAFDKVKYLNSELIRGKIDFVDISSLEREKRVDTEASIVRPLEAQLWSDNEEKENASLSANTWTFAIEHAGKRLKERGEADKKTISGVFHATTLSDLPLIELAADFNVKEAKHLEKVADAVARCTHGAKSPARLIGALTWLVHFKQVPARFIMYLKTVYDSDLITEEAVRAWYAAPAATLLADLPESEVVIGEAEIAVLKKAAVMFIQWLDQQGEESEEGSDEEEEED